MTERKIQDYLPYYIGQEIERHFQGELVVSELTAENLAGFISAWDSRWHKLRLRPLSDMTEEEKIELAGIFGWIWGDDYYKANQVEGLFINNGFYNKQTNITGNAWCKAFCYLLSKGFDLFGFIESNLAINKSTIQK